MDESTARGVADQVKQAEEKAVHVAKSLCDHEGGCRLCHAFDPKAKSPDRLIPEIAKPRIPERWFAYARFNHDRHKMWACGQCHIDSLTGKSVDKSESTGDVLIPKIETCFKCHTAAGAQASTKEATPHSQPASNHCVDCHTYHTDPLETKFKGEHTIDLEFLRAGQATVRNAPQNTSDRP